jgi:hypothetical protein
MFRLAMRGVAPARRPREVEARVGRLIEAVGHTAAEGIRTIHGRLDDTHNLLVEQTSKK